MPLFPLMEGDNMSATAFQRRRREIAKQKKSEKQLSETILNETELSKLKNDELKGLLDEKGIEYDARAKKEDLIKLLKGAE
jgi:hypothetical protein